MTSTPRARRLRRRTFFRLSLLAVLGMSGVALDRVTQPAGAINTLRWLGRAQLKRIGPPSVVALAHCPSYADDIFDCLEGLWREAAMPDVHGKRVLVKPNLLDMIEGHPVTTAPEVIGAVVRLLEDQGASEIAVGDGPAFRRDVMPVVRASGLAAVLAARHVPFVDLNYDDPRPAPARDGWFTKVRELWLPRHAREADLIVSVPKLKTHHWTGVSLSLKNLFGTIPGVYYGWPKNMLHVNGINASILGVHASLPPVVAVVDGIVGMEGDGPLFGTPVTHGLLAVGADPVAVDATCITAMGLPRSLSTHIWAAGWAGRGQTERIEVRGKPPEELQRMYQPPPTL